MPNSLETRNVYDMRIEAVFTISRSQYIQTKWEMTKSLTPSCMAFERFTISLWVAHLIYEKKIIENTIAKGETIIAAT